MIRETDINGLPDHFWLESDLLFLEIRSEFHYNIF